MSKGKTIKNILPGLLMTSLSVWMVVSGVWFGCMGSMETVGWFRFLDHSKKALPAIDKHWEVEISTPAFEIKLTVVYDRANRALKDVTDEYCS